MTEPNSIPVIAYLLDSISTTAKRVVSTVAAAPGCAWSGELRLPTQAGLAPIYALEVASYPADEAASEEGMKFRLANAATFFRAFYCTEAPHAPASAVPTTHLELPVAVMSYLLSEPSYLRAPVCALSFVTRA